MSEAQRPDEEPVRGKNLPGEKHGFNAADQEKISVAASGTTNPNGQGGYNAGMAVFSYIIGGIVVWSLIGWGLDILLGTHWIVLAGVVVGLVGAFYLAFARRLTRTRSQDRPGPAPGAGDSEHQ